MPGVDKVLTAREETEMANGIRPPVWQMVRQAIDALRGRATTGELKDWIERAFPGTNAGTVQNQIGFCTVNNPARVHEEVNREAREANGQYDFLFQVARGEYERFDSRRHGRWCIREVSPMRFQVEQLEAPRGQG